MSTSVSTLTRRQFCASTAATLLAAPTLLPTGTVQAEAKPEFQLNYMLASCMYGYMKLDEIMPEVSKIGANAIDLWPKVHGNQREQLDEIGLTKFREMLLGWDVKLGCITQYKLGPFGLQNEMRLAQKLACGMLVCGGAGPKGLAGSELKAAVREFVEKMKPHLEVAEETGVTIAIENHANNLIDSPDSLKWLLEFRPNAHLSIALAPYHLPQDEKLLAQLIRDLGSDGISLFYAWEHGQGSMTKLPKEEELMQLPGRGKLDFTPLLAALKQIRFSGKTEIFMHPVPRGIPIHETAAEVTAEINRSRHYLTQCLERI